MLLLVLYFVWKRHQMHLFIHCVTVPSGDVYVLLLRVKTVAHTALTANTNQPGRAEASTHHEPTLTNSVCTREPHL